MLKHSIELWSLAWQRSGLAAFLLAIVIVYMSICFV